MPLRLRPSRPHVPRGTPPRTIGRQHLVPAAARIKAFAKAAAVEQHAALNEHGVEVFLAAVGGRGKLLEVLTVASESPEVGPILDLLSDPRYDRMAIKRLCTITGTSVATLFGAYRKALLARAHVEAAHIIADKLPPIIEDVMTRATPQPLVCELCQGSGRVNQIAPGLPPVPCPRCTGSGQVRSEPDLDRQKLALELGQLTQKGGGISITQQQGVLAAGGTTLAVQGPGALEQLHQAVGELLFSPGRRRGQSPTPIGEPDIPATPLTDPSDPLGPADPDGPDGDDRPAPDHDDDDIDDDKEATHSPTT